MTARRIARRAPLLAMVALLAAATIAGTVDSLSPGAGGPTSSAYSTASDGLAAYAALLARSGHPVTQLRSSAATAHLDPSQTLVLLDPNQITTSDAVALRRFVTAGGVLVAGGRDPGWLAGVVPGAPAWSPHGPSVSQRLAPAPQIAGVGQVLSAGEGSWTSAHATLPVLGAAGGSLLSVASVGSGHVALLADASPLQNDHLAQLDNAALGLGLAGPSRRPIAFLESVHGFGAAGGLAALPVRWKWALAGLALALAVAIAARIRRLADPEMSVDAALPPRRALVEALARALSRTGRPGEAAQTVGSHARAVLLRRAALPGDAPESAVAGAAARLGLDPAETRALSSPALADGDVLAAGRALAKLSGTMT